MKYLISLLLLVSVIGCSTSPFEQQTRRQNMINEHLAQGVRNLDGNFDARFSTDGNDGMYLRKVGTAVYPIGYNENLVRSAAIADGKFKLISSAPSELKSMVQKAIGNSLGYVGEYNQIETSVTEVYALQGIDYSERDIQCKTQVTPTVSGSYKTERICKAIVKVTLVALTKSFDFTIEKKYGIKKKSQVQKILQQQLKNTVLKAPVSQKAPVVSPKVSMVKPVQKK